MGVSLGTKNLAPQFPYIDGAIWNDSVTRNGNTVSFSVNLQAWVRTNTGYWNYAWYIDIECGSIKKTNLKIKNQTYKNEVIGGKSYWLSTNNGNFTGTVDVNGMATSIPIKVTFHDSAGNWGEPQTWYTPIPTASSMSAVKTSATNLTPESAIVNAWVDSNGAYSEITKWALNCNGQTYTQEGNNLKATWNLTSLQPATYYSYTTTVTNSAGYSKSSSGSFFTEDSTIGHLVIDGQPTKILSGWVVNSDGTSQRIKSIKKV